MEANLAPFETMALAPLVKERDALGYRPVRRSYHEAGRMGGRDLDGGNG